MAFDSGNGERLSRRTAPECKTSTGTADSKLRAALGFTARGQQRLAIGLVHAAVAACLLGGAVGASVGVAFAEGDAAAVKIDNFTFTPQSVTVKAGTTVTWTNHDDIPHTVTSTTKQFRSHALDTDDKFSFTFSTPGTYEYFCSLHPHMTGTIVVEAPAGAGADP